MVARLSDYLPYPFPQTDQQQARRQLDYLNFKPGKNVYLRFFYHSEDFRKNNDKGRKIDWLRWKDVENYQQDGRGVYVVVNGAGGGHEDKDIKECAAIFCEWDDSPVDEQLLHWETVGFLEPTFTIYSGDKSAQPYWVFDKPISVSQWRELQLLLIEVMGADPANKNPSRVFRLAGGWHVKPGRNPVRTEIVQECGKKYSAQQLLGKLREIRQQQQPQLEQPTLPRIEPQQDRSLITQAYQRYEDIQVPVPDSVPIDVCLSKGSQQLLQSGATTGSRNTNGAKLARDLIGTADHLREIGQRFDGDPWQLFLDYCHRCPSGKGWGEGEWKNIWKSAESDHPKPSCKEDGVQTCVRAWYWSNHIKPNQPGREHIRLHPDTISFVKQRADIFNIISEHIALSKRGKDFVGLCPFHDDKAPSFSVSPSKQMYHCFGCGAFGDAIKFLMELGKHSFSDVVLDLARRYQVQARSIDGSKVPVRNAPLSYQVEARDNGGSKGEGGNTLSSVTLEQRIDEILDRNLDESDEDVALLHLSRAYGTTKRDIVDISKKRLSERELTDNRSERLLELKTLENLERANINLERVFYRQPAVGKALKQLCLVRSLRAEYFLGILPIAAMLSGTGTTLKIASDFIVPTVLNIGLVGESSDRKSVVSNLLMNPLRRIQSEMYELHKKQKAEYLKAVAAWEQLNPKTRGPSPREDEFVTVPDAPFIVTEQTREGLVKASEKNRNGLLLYKAELASVSKGFNVYRGGRGDDEEFFNNLWDGDEITRVLASQETVRISKTCIPQFGGIQPQVLLQLMDMNDPNGRWARYLWILCPLEKRKTSFLDPVVDVSPMLYSMYSRMMRANKTEHVLSREALVLFDQQNQLYEDLQFSNPQAGMRALYGKIPGMIARIALNLHRMNAAAALVDPEVEIPIEAVQVAIEVVQFCLGQLTIIRAMGEASVEHEYGLTAVYRQIQNLATRIAGKEEVLTARRVLSARLPVFQGKKAPDIVRIFKDMAAMGKAELTRVKRSLGLLVSSVIGGGDSNEGGGGNGGGNGGGGNDPNSPPINLVNPVDEIAEIAEDLLLCDLELEPSNLNTSSCSAELLNLLKDVESDTTPPSITAHAFSATSADGGTHTHTGIQEIQRYEANTQQKGKLQNANSTHNQEEALETAELEVVVASVSQPPPPTVKDVLDETERVIAPDQPLASAPFEAPNNSGSKQITQARLATGREESLYTTETTETTLPALPTNQEGSRLSLSCPSSAPFSVDGIGGQPQQTPTGTTASETGTFPKGEGQLSDNTDNCESRQTTQKGLPLPCGRNSLQTEFKVGSSVALADPYTVAYSYHGKVESVFGNEAVVRWAERRGQPNECENYKIFVLRLLSQSDEA